MREEFRRSDLGDRRIALAFVLAALLCGYGACTVVDTAGWNALLAVVPVAAVLAVFGWFRRTHDILAVVLPAVVIAYSGYVGIAIARVPHMTTIIAASALGGAGFLTPEDSRWPLVLTAGLPFALILTVAVALPVSKIRTRRQASHADDALWAFISEQSARAAKTPGRHGEQLPFE
jgi:hypothetical protein